MDRTKAVTAIVGGGSLFGREIRDLLSEVGIEVKLIGADPEEFGVLTEEAGEPVLMTALDEENLSGAQVVFLAGSAESSRRALELLARLDNRPVVIDTTYSLEDRPGAYVRAPLVEPANYLPPTATEHVIAHPAAISLALFLTRLQQVQPLQRAVAHVFEPASERGQRGLEELEKQTVNLLTLQNLPKDVYDEQVGFNVLARYGSEAPLSIERIEQRLERHLATLLSLHGGVPMPSFRVLQVPVFHGHSFSIWVQFEQEPDVQRLEAALGTAHIDVRGRDLEPPNIVGIAGQSGIAVGAIAIDHNAPRACWFWVVSDNLRIVAENAVAVARLLLGHPGRARPQ